MPATLTTHAVDQSSYIVSCAFTDHNGDEVVPSSITWDLYDGDGDVINSRSAVAVEEPAASIDILLSGDDLKYSDGRYRVLKISAAYDSEELGNDIPIVGSTRFVIDAVL